MTMSMKKRLLKAKMTLQHTLQKILDINRHRKRLPHYEDPAQREETLSQELKVLNKIAAQQAKLIRYYESALENRR